MALHFATQHTIADIIDVFARIGMDLNEISAIGVKDGLTSQLPVVNWHQALGDPTMADAILDRVVHNAYKMELIGEDSMRKLLADIDAGKPM